MVEKTPALSIVVPVYNGARTVGELVHALAAIDIPGGLEIVLVNDGSPDDSLAVCRALVEEGSAPITLLNLSRNFGEHNAVMAGLRAARGDYIVTMDDDLQNPPSEVKRLYEYTRDGGFEVVYTRYDEKQHEGWRNLGSRFNGFVADVLLAKPKGLYLSSFRCMSAFVAREVTRYTGPFPYVDGLILQTTRTIGRLTVLHLPRAEGRSNYTMRRLVRLWMNMALSFSILPLRIATLLGFALGALGVLGFIGVLLEAMTGSPPIGWSSTVSLVLVLSGCQLMMLGIVGEYVGRLFVTINGRPQSIVRDVIETKKASKKPSAAAE
jgi:undecaprenyl-phosphate 4-deoxy-4-formamido-L-arabinose transferase